LWAYYSDKGLIVAIDHLSDKEIARELARRLRAWRVDPRGAGLTQQELARRSGVGTTPLKRFEKTGGVTLNNLIGMLRAMGLLDRLEALVPEPSTPSPMELLSASRAEPKPRTRAPRRVRAGAGKAGKRG
jgi:transcriptional regulator with XRE-family HTH domain